MASVTRLWSDLLRPLGDAAAKHYDTSGNVINSLRKGIEARFFRPDGSINKELVAASGGKFRPGRTVNRDHTINGKTYKAGEVIPDRVKKDDLVLAKSLFYNQNGRLQESRVAGAAVGFGGGTIAGLNLVGDMVFGD